jgi:hypothetical protein
MRITRTTPSGPAAPGTPARRAEGAPGFGALVETAEADGAQGAAAPGALADVGALLAVQAAGDATAQAKRRAARQGREVLDALTEVQRALLSGGSLLDAATSARNAGARARASDTGGDARLAALLDAIDLRAAVEAAKARA